MALRLYQPDESAQPEPARPSTTIVALGEREYQLEFWADRRWDVVQAPPKPGAVRAHSDDGWFRLAPISPRRR